MGKFIDRTSNSYGRLIVISREKNSKTGSARWKCICECGKTKIVLAQSLESGGTNSCGCLDKERRTTHGFSRHPLYFIWGSMKRRCYDKKYPSFVSYGGRGIIVCDEWKDFSKFYADMATGYKKGLSIDRIDNNKGYSKQNCRWATPKIQGNNRRDNKIIEYGFCRRTVSDWARARKVGSHVLYQRIKKGWGIAAILFTPVNQKRKIGEAL